MAITNPAKHLAHRPRRLAFGPRVAFVAAGATAFVSLVVFTMTLPRDLVLPLVATLFFLLAGVIALFAWHRGHAVAQPQLTYWDVAGALTFIGICAASMIDPDQMVRIAHGVCRDN